MTKEELAWFVGQVQAWRRGLKGPRRVDARALAVALTQLGRAGLSEALVGYVILGCEWLFRIFPSEPRSRERRRVLAADTELAPPPALSFSQLVGPTPTREGTGRVDPTFGDRGRGWSMPVAPGPPPWLAPWMAGYVVERLLMMKRGASRARATYLALPLVSALNGLEVDETDYRDRGRALERAEIDATLPWPAEPRNDAGEPGKQAGLQSALVHLVDEFQHRVEILATAEHPPELEWPRDWCQILRDRLDMLGPQNVFPADRLAVEALVRAHPRRGGQKR